MYGNSLSKLKRQPFAYPQCSRSGLFHMNHSATVKGNPKRLPFAWDRWPYSIPRWNFVEYLNAVVTSEDTRTESSKHTNVRTEPAPGGPARPAVREFETTHPPPHPPTHLGHHVLDDDHLVGIHVDLQLRRITPGVFHRVQKVSKVVEVQLDEVARHLDLLLEVEKTS